MPPSPEWNRNRSRGRRGHGQTAPPCYQIPDYWTNPSGSGLYPAHTSVSSPAPRHPPLPPPSPSASRAPPPDSPRARGPPALSAPPPPWHPRDGSTLLSSASRHPPRSARFDCVLSWAGRRRAGVCLLSRTALERVRGLVCAVNRSRR